MNFICLLLFKPAVIIFYSNHPSILLRLNLNIITVLLVLPLSNAQLHGRLVSRGLCGSGWIEGNRSHARGEGSVLPSFRVRSLISVFPPTFWRLPRRLSVAILSCGPFQDKMFLKGTSTLTTNYDVTLLETS